MNNRTPQSTANPRKTLIFRALAATVAAIIAIGLCLFTQDNVNASIKQRRIERLNARIANVYTSDYQQMAQEDLEANRDKDTHTADDPYVQDNPYGTITNSLYVYFTTDYATKISYTVSADGYPDFTQSVAQDEEYQKEHEFLVLGLIPDVENTITFTITDDNGLDITHSITHQGPSLLGTEEVRLEQTVSADDATELGDGLYAILGNDSDEQDFMYLYDTDGVLRGEVPVCFYRSHRLLFDDDGLMWFSASTHLMVGMNRLGKLEKIYSLGDRYILHHDYAFDSDQNLVIMATDQQDPDHAVQDHVVKLDTDTGEVTELVDFGDIFTSYKEATTRAGMDESDPTATNRWDWLHTNTIQMLPDGSAIFSARETSTIFKISDIEGTPTLEWMVGEPSVWDVASEFQSYFLTKNGDFSDTGGQHSVTYEEDDSLPDGQYYLYMFDNNYGYCEARPDYDWTTIEGISTTYQNDSAKSQYRKYLIDENAGTYTEITQFDVPYSAYVSSAQELDNGNILIDSGYAGAFGTYDTDGNLLAQFKMKLNKTYIYRVYQYDFKGFFFA